MTASVGLEENRTSRIKAREYRNRGRRPNAAPYSEGLIRGGGRDLAGVVAARHVVGQDDDIGVLLERTRVAQVRELGLAKISLALLGLAGELRQRQDGNLELLGEQ